MLIALVGGSGWTGSELLFELVSRGHEVRAVVRRPDAVDRAVYPTVEQLVADAYDVDALREAFTGVDVVVSAFNPGWADPQLYDHFLSGSRAVQAAARGAGVVRLLVVGGAASLYGEDGRQLIESMPLVEPYAPGVRAARDYHAELAAETELDWTFLSPPPQYGPMGPTGRRGTYRTGLDSPVVDEVGHSSISAPDLALAVVDELERPRHQRQRFTVGY